MNQHILLICWLSLSRQIDTSGIVINTWAFTAATESAAEELRRGRSSLDAVVAGCRTCQRLQCDGTVGFGGSPDESGETTLDAMIMNGNTMNVGAVGCLRRIKDAIGVARLVLDLTHHSLLVGELATRFATEMGFTEESLNSPHSNKMWAAWKNRSCQPNFWKNVNPDPRVSCGPYGRNELSLNSIINVVGHDTIGMVALDDAGLVAAGTSTNGLAFKIPGRVGDSPIPGAGAYADSEVGGAAATGDGDVMLRMLPSFLAVEEMRQRRVSPRDAAKVAIDRIAHKYPHFTGGIVVLNKNHGYGAACHGMYEFPFAVSTSSNGKVTIKRVRCSNIRKQF